jgi:dTDP-4-dehydrorhamnose reductase
MGALMRVLVAGAEGMLGRDVVAAGLSRGLECVGLSHAQLDVTDERAVAAAVAGAAPDVVVNCAGWTDVDGAEDNEAAALAVNGAGAGNLARAAREAGAQMLHVSTDYVFDGTATRPYVESDPTGPRTAYGRTKLAGEYAVLGASHSHAVVRTAWLFGPGGANFVATMLRLAAAGRDEVAVVTDQVGCPTFTGHLAEKLLDLAWQRRGGVFHAAAAGQCSWNEFAQAIFAAAGVEVRVTATTSDALARPAARPAWSVLASERGGSPLPAWEDGLSAYLALAPIGLPQ